MLFNSIEYIFLFLPATFFCYWYLAVKGHHIASHGALVIASLFFYAWWKPEYLPLILGSMFFNYWIGSQLAARGSKKLLTVGIIANLSLLGYFKYTDFLIENVNSVTSSDFSTHGIILPLAISFFTFQQIAYLVDSYKGLTQEYKFYNYSLFVTFFPQLIAGPIVHHKEMMPQFERRDARPSLSKINLGIFIFSMGLFKKLVLADTFAVWANAGFDAPTVLTFFEAWGASLSYTLQLYFDFSGYVDMAIGSALLFNIKLPINFNSPYKSINIQEFWRRWHITLSRFLRDYIYIPLGGNQVAESRIYFNLMMTFVIGGIWHGASWMFVFWGFLHGFALIIHRFWTKYGFSLGKPISWFLTFNFVNFAWIFFRAESWSDSTRILEGMIGLNGFELPVQLRAVLGPLESYGFFFGNIVDGINGDFYTPVWILCGLVIALLGKSSISFLDSFKPSFSYFLLNVFTLFVALSYLSKPTEFLYFNF